MKIEYITGDLLISDEKVIAHGCNAQGVMRSGIANLIRQMYPEAYNAYKSHYTEYGLNVGDCIFAYVNDKVIINIISQQFYGRTPNIVYVSYDGIEKAIRKLNYSPYDRIAFPLIGAGLANGSWPIISKIIEETSTFRPVVYTLDGVIPNG